MLSATGDQAAGRQLLLAHGTLMHQEEQGWSLGSANLLSPERSASKWHLLVQGQGWPSIISISKSQSTGCGPTAWGSSENPFAAPKQDLCHSGIKLSTVVPTRSGLPMSLKLPGMGFPLLGQTPPALT